MNKISADRVEEIFENIQNLKVAVIGDLMLDRYVWGRVERISPEAPVPIVSLGGESSKLGGAANVAANVGALGAEVRLFGVIGDDPEGERLRDLVGLQDYSKDGIITDPDRVTSVKTRVIAQNQHIIRIDSETITDISNNVALKLVGRFGTDLNRFNCVIIQDYNKGVLTPVVIRQVVDACRSSEVLVGVDPKRENFWNYTGVNVFKPNLRELEAATGLILQEDESLVKTGQEIIERLGLNHLLVTRGEKGMALITDGEVELVPTQAHRVHDVSGAGDTVIATIMTALAGGADIREAAILANYAASIVIAEVGAVPVNPDILRRVSAA